MSFPEPCTFTKSPSPIAELKLDEREEGEYSISFTLLYITVAMVVSSSSDIPFVTILSSIKYVFENCGYEVLADTRRINAFMLDLVPKRDSEREILKKVLTENTGNILIKAYGQTDDDKKAIFSECFEKLKENTELKENEIIFALNTLSESLDIGYQLSEIKEEISAKVLKKGDIPTNVRNIEEYLNDVAEISYKALSCNTECEKAIIPESVKQIKSKAEGKRGCIYICRQR